MVNHAPLLFLLAAGVHAGFQLTVTALVYPALSRVPAQRWEQEHARHSRAIVPLVGVVYLLLAGSVSWLLITDRTGSTYLGAGVAAAIAAVTAFGAAPIHGGLTARDDAAVRRLLRVDYVRAVLGVLLVLIALSAVL